MSYENPFSIGLDLGQINDYTALAIVEKVKSLENGDVTHFHLRRLERYPLGTTYPRIADHVAGICNNEALARLKQRDLTFRGVVVTGGERTISSAGSSHVPKRDLVNALLVTMQNGHLKVSPELSLWPTLRQEMQTFKRKIDLRTSHDSYEHWRETDHDDLVLAVCLACWGAVNRRRGAQVYSF
jgi:hypothetical protein